MQTTVIFSDEKYFTLDQARNRQNDRTLSPGNLSTPRGKNTVYRHQNLAGVMVWAVVCKESRSPLIFVEPGVKVYTEYYVKVTLEKGLLP